MKLSLVELNRTPEFDSGIVKPYTQIVVDVEHLEHVSLNLGDVCLFLGVVVDMPGHIVFATPDGRVLWGYHDDNFRLYSETALENGD